MAERPQITTEQWAKVRTLLDAVNELPPAERVRRLAAVDSSDPVVAAQVRRMLEWRERLGNFLLPVSSLPEDMAEQVQGSSAVRERHESSTFTLASAAGSDKHRFVGRYRLVRPIATGGMGEVFEAVCDRPRRRVAIKVIRPGLTSPHTLRRFEHEAHYLGRLRHPGIAQIYEAGTYREGPGAPEVPFFAMEYIGGAKTIIEYAAEKDLDIRQRLILLAAVCDAVHHGHLRGVIHRDLKPGNILMDRATILPETSLAQPKVIDFGVARATDADVALTTLQTEAGQLVGTLQYMSPEQCSEDPGEVDVRSDVYALGVIGYELLSGQPPHRLSGKSIVEAVRVIREEEAAPLSGASRVFRGDVETIIAKALEKDRDRRYGSAAELADDLRRYLSERPIQARPPSSFYQLRKFARRNRVLVAGMATTFIVLVAGLLGTGYGLSQALAARNAEAEQRLTAEANEQKAIQEADRAEREAERALVAEREAEARAAELEQVAEFQASQLSGIDTALMGVRLRSDLLAKRRAALESRGIEEIAIEASLKDLESALSGVNFTNVALGTLDENIFERALAAIEEDFADQPLVEARLLQSVATTLRDLGLLDEATAPQAKALEIRRQVLGDEHPDTLTSMSCMGGLLNSQGKRAEAEPYYRNALEGRRRLLGDEHPDTLKSINEMGYLHHQQGKPAEAEPYWREALETRRRVLGDDHRDTLNSINDMGILHHSQGELAEAEPYYREAVASKRRVLGDEHPSTLSSINNLGLLLHWQGKLAEAEVYFREALDTERRVLGDDHPNTLQTINNMGHLLHSQGKLAESEPYWREALQGRRRVLGDEHPDTLRSITNLGAILRDLERYEEGEALGAEAVQRARETLPGADRRRAYHLGHHARTLAKMERFAEAELEMLEAHEIIVEALGEGDERITGVIKRLIELYDSWHAAEPEGSHDAKAAQWRATLANSQEEPQTQPPGPVETPPAGEAEQQP